MSAHRMTIRAGIRFFSEHTFAIPEPVVNDYFSVYKLVYWEGKYLIDAICIFHIITRDGIDYRVIYNRTLTRQQIAANKDRQYALSFRMPKDEWDLGPIVIISES